MFMDFGVNDNLPSEAQNQADVTFNTIDPRRSLDGPSAGLRRSTQNQRLSSLSSSLFGKESNNISKLGLSRMRQDELLNEILQFQETHAYISAMT